MNQHTKNSPLLQWRCDRKCKVNPIELSLDVEAWFQVVAFQPQVDSPHQGQN